MCSDLGHFDAKRSAISGSYLKWPVDAVIKRLMGRLGVAYLPVAFVVCAQFAFAPCALAGPHDELVAKHAAANGVPEQLVHRIIRIESREIGRAHV